MSASYLFGVCQSGPFRRLNQIVQTIVTFKGGNLGTGGTQQVVYKAIEKKKGQRSIFLWNGTSFELQQKMSV